MTRIDAFLIPKCPDCGSNMGFVQYKTPFKSYSFTTEEITWNFFWCRNRKCRHAILDKIETKEITKCPKCKINLGKEKFISNRCPNCGKKL